MPTVRMPDLSRPHRYEHRRPRRPSHLPKRLTPPPERADPPDMSWFLYAGIVLALIVVIVAIPYAIVVIVELLST
jgi:hypothetical protein